MATTNTNTHTEAAQATIEKIRALQQEIPNLVVPDSKKATQKLAPAASVPPQFVETAAVAVTNSPTLASAGNASPDAVRDLISYAASYTAVAQELEALAKLVRHSVKAAQNKAGRHALNTYATAKRLSKQPETIALIPVADALRQTLNRKVTKAKDEPAPGTPPAPPAPQPTTPPVTTK